MYGSNNDCHNLLTETKVTHNMYRRRLKIHVRCFIRLNGNKNRMKGVLRVTAKIEQVFLSAESALRLSISDIDRIFYLQ